MKVLMIGGSGLISSEVTKRAIQNGIDLTLITRGNQLDKLPSEVTKLVCDINDEKKVLELIEGQQYDVVVDWIAFELEHIKRDIRLFGDKMKQYIFISSASVYSKPLQFYPIKESHPIGNDFWEYSNNKAVIENYLKEHKQDFEFDYTIVRPAHTYDDHSIIGFIMCWHAQASLLYRIKNELPVIVPGDGTSLWTLTHSFDFAKLFVPLLGNEKAYGETFHLTSNFTYTWEQITNLYAEAYGVQPNIVKIPTEFIYGIYPHFKGELWGDKSWSLIFDNTKINQLTMNPVMEIKLEDVIMKTVEYYEGDNNIDMEWNVMIDHIITEFKKAS